MSTHSVSTVNSHPNFYLNNQFTHTIFLEECGYPADYVSTEFVTVHTKAVTVPYPIHTEIVRTYTVYDLKNKCEVSTGTNISTALCQTTRRQINNFFLQTPSLTLTITIHFNAHAQKMRITVKLF